MAEYKNIPGISGTINIDTSNSILTGSHPIGPIVFLFSSFMPGNQRALNYVKFDSHTLAQTNLIYSFTLIGLSSAADKFFVLTK
jgi:hypothetical protein